MALMWGEPGTYLNIDRNEFVGQRRLHPQHKASPSQTVNPVRNNSTSSSGSCCDCFFSVKQSSGSAAEVLNFTVTDSFSTPKASRQYTCSSLHGWSCASQLPQKLVEEKTCLDQSPEGSIWHSATAAAPLPSTSSGPSRSKHAMQSDLLKQAQAARTEAVQKAEVAAKLVAKAQRLARIAKAHGRLELQSSVSTTASSHQRDGLGQPCQSSTNLVLPSCAPKATYASRVHSKTRAGAAAVAACQAQLPQVLPAEDSPADKQQQQQQQRQEHWVSALLKQSSSESSTVFSALRHAHAGTKRSQEAASLPSAEPCQMSCKSRRLERNFPSSPAQVGSGRHRHTSTQQAAEAANGAAFGQQHDVTEVPAVTAMDCIAPCDICADDAACLPAASCQLQTADCQPSCRPAVQAHMHRQSSTDFAWAGAGASNFDTGCSASSRLLACVKSEPQLSEEMTHQQARLPDLRRWPSQQLDSQQIGHGGSSDSAAALRQQHQLQMIDLMLARVSAAEKAIQQGLFQSHQSEPYLNDPWAPAESCNMLLHDMESSTPGDVDFAGIDLLLHGGQQAECKLEEVAVMDDSTSNGKNTSSVHIERPDDMLEGCTGRTHSSSGSTTDCPGLCLVPKDWLIDGNDEVDLAYFSTVSGDGSMLGLALPLMLPSLLL